MRKSTKTTLYSEALIFILELLSQVKSDCHENLWLLRKLFTLEFFDFLPWLGTIVSQPSKCLKFMTFREGCFVIHVEYKYLSEALETFYHHQFYKRWNKIISVN